MSKKRGKSSRLKFTKEEQKAAKEQAATKKLERKVTKTGAKADKYGGKRDKYREKQPVREVRVKERIYNEERGRPQTKIRFEKEVIPINEAKWNNPKPKTVKQKIARAGKKSVKMAQTAAVNQIHRKIYQVEHENVGTQAAHRAELVGESAYRGGKKLTRSAYRFVRNTPYRRAAKFEVKSVKAQTKLEYQKALRDNPKLRSNPVSRFFQKRSIKKQYADALRTAKKSGKTTKKTVGAVKKVTQTVNNIVRRNPIFLLKAGLLLLIIFMIMALFSMCGTLLSGGSGFVGATSYAAGDTDINQSELSYTEWETDLLMEAMNAETSHSGYDEYRYDIGSVGHNPLELMAFLTAVYEDFTYSEFESVLRDIFAEQYQLTFTPEVEIRYRTETRTGSYTDGDGNTVYYDYDVEVPYEWHILNVTLTAQPLSPVISPRMSADQTEHYTLLILSRGSRQLVGNPFTFDVLPYVTSYYGYRVHPITGAKDYHKGLDIGLPEGTEIRAGVDGTVTTAAYDSGYGNYVVIEQRKDDGTVIEVKYAHCHTLLVSAGQTVSIGDVIATVGNTGSSTGAHLHIEVVKDGAYMNPIYYMVSQY